MNRASGDTLVDTLRQLEQQGSSARLVLRTSSERGEVAVDGGQLVAAVSGGLRGREALFALLFEGAEVKREVLTAEPMAEMPADSRMPPSPITLTLKRAQRLGELWQTRWSRAAFVADDTPLLGGNVHPADASLLLFFDRPTRAGQAVQASGLRPGGMLERFDKLMTLGVLVELDIDEPEQPASYTPQPSSQFIAQITPEMIGEFVQAAAREADESGEATGPFAIVLSDSGVRSQQLCQTIQVGQKREILSLSSSDLKEALLHPGSPVLLDGSDRATASLSILRQLMLLSPRPILWIYQRPEEAEAAIEAVRFGAVGAWRIGSEDTLEDWIQVLQRPGQSRAVKRLRYVNIDTPGSSLANALGAVFAGMGGVTAAIEVLCNLEPSHTAATLFVHWLPHDQASALFQLLDRHSPFHVRNNVEDQLHPGELLMSHWRDRRLATPCKEGNGFRLLSSIDDGTPDMWLSQLSSHNQGRAVAMVLGQSVLTRQQKVHGLDTLFCYDRCQETPLPGDRVAFEELTSRFADALKNAGTSTS